MSEPEAPTTAAIDTIDPAVLADVTAKLELLTVNANDNVAFEGILEQACEYPAEVSRFMESKKRGG